MGESSRTGDKTGHEVELKLRVDDLAALLAVAMAAGGQPEPTAIQRNQYFDTPDRAWDKNKLVLRLREERGGDGTAFFLTAKGPANKAGDGALTVVAEEETAVTADTAAQLRGGRDPLAFLDGGGDSRRQLVAALRTAAAHQSVAIVGEFINERTRLPTTLQVGARRTPIVLELDRVVFPGNQIHHEIECELAADVDPEQATLAFFALFAQAGVVGRRAPGKASRFFAALRGERL